ncbi:MAG: hypothetical protein A2Z91_01975 [Deltaproteobacteria bacterium GWA2_38_16]|nr:MAG: hypothetical protein A2Z91_01975 [Deltaproteobacteria bacterium GWA2_38_16]OGQ01963.1 MAG: hypothetical protein A3D19_08270 [Deltaproteobacteria bacterium RIFCSPHIGHO2_02_FULL_38_15]OGQ33660.1 MAG: hypothetical protein A3A72_05535 [Deltaproteobacteria bacterium RIFCSPLOWO2_01_FULL_38_9]HBQ21496.1 hypothetical protein [Deltaproteobacteria bacterium]
MNKYYFLVFLMVFGFVSNGWPEKDDEKDDAKEDAIFSKKEEGRIDKMEAYEILPGSGVPLPPGDVRIGILTDLTAGFNYNVEASTNILANILTLLNLDMSWAPILDPKWGAFQFGSSVIYNPNGDEKNVVVPEKNVELLPYFQHSVFLADAILQHTSISRSYFRALYGEGSSILFYDRVIRDSSIDDIHLRTTTEMRLRNKKDEYCGSLALALHLVPALGDAVEKRFYMGEVYYTFAWKVFHLKLGLSAASRNSVAESYGHVFPVLGMYWTL